MMQKQRKNNNNITQIMIGAFALIMLCSTFLVIELNRNEKQEIALYNTAQQSLLERCAAEVQVSLAVGENSAENLGQIVKSYVPYQGSSWGYFCKNDEVIFASDADTTGLWAGETRSSLLAGFPDMLELSVTFSADNNTYVIGKMYSKSYFDELSKNYIHRMYLLIDFAVLAVAFFLIVVYQAAKRKKQEQKMEKQEQRMHEQNIRLEAFSEEVLMQPEEQQKEVFQKYDAALLEKLLEKTVDPALYPFGLYWIQIQMKDKYFSKQEMQKLAEPIRSRVESKQLLLEVAKGEFVLLLYQAKEQSYQNAEDFLEKEWKQQLGDMDILMAGFYTTQVSKQLVEQYQNLRKECIEKNESPASEGVENEI